MPDLDVVSGRDNGEMPTFNLVMGWISSDNLSLLIQFKFPLPNCYNMLLTRVGK